MRAEVIVGVGLLVFLGIDGWLSDFITLKGDATVYTANCEGGNWRNASCTGHLAAGARYRFHAVKARGEVLYWTPGQSASPGTLQGCQIRSGRNWRCTPTRTALPTIAYALEHGLPVRTADAALVECHPISKERWYLLRLGQSAKAVRWPAMKLA